MRFQGKCTSAKRPKLQKLGRVSSVNITSIRLWRWYRRRRGEIVGRGDVAYYPVKHLSPWFPVTRQPCVVLAESVWKPARTLSPPVSVLWLNYTGSAYYPPLNYSLLTTKIVPCHPCFSSHGFPVFSRLSYNVSLRSSSQPHRRYILCGCLMVTFVFPNLFQYVCLSPAIVGGYGHKIIVRWISRHSRVLFTKILRLISLFVYIFIYESKVKQRIIRENIYDVIVTIHEKIRMSIHISELILYRVDSMILILFLDAIWNN